jgi:hypothetical protein
MYLTAKSFADSINAGDVKVTHSDEQAAPAGAQPF